MDSQYAKELEVFLRRELSKDYNRRRDDQETVFEYHRQIEIKEDRRGKKEIKVTREVYHKDCTGEGRLVGYISFETNRDTRIRDPQARKSYAVCIADREGVEFYDKKDEAIDGFLSRGMRKIEDILNS